MTLGSVSRGTTTQTSYYPLNYPHRSQSMSSHTSRTAPVYVASGPVRPSFDSQSDIDYPVATKNLRALSPEDINKLKYKIDLGDFPFHDFLSLV